MSTIQSSCALLGSRSALKASTASPNHSRRPALVTSSSVTFLETTRRLETGRPSAFRSDRRWEAERGKESREDERVDLRNTSFFDPEHVHHRGAEVGLPWLTGVEGHRELPIRPRDHGLPLDLGYEELLSVEGHDRLAPVVPGRGGRHRQPRVLSKQRRKDRGIGSLVSIHVAPKEPALLLGRIGTRCPLEPARGEMPPQRRSCPPQRAVHRIHGRLEEPG